MKKDLTKVKTRLIELGYIDNEWLDKYLEIIEANLETKRNRASTQAHHAIPVNDYWTSDEPYNRSEAIKLARADKVNFEVHLLYKDHLLVHGYLTLCTDLDKLQKRYESKSEMRKLNSAKASIPKNDYRIKMPKKITEEKILTKLAVYDEAHKKAQDDGDDKAEHKYRCLVAQWKSRYRQFLEDPERYTESTVKKPYYQPNTDYHLIAKQKQEMKIKISLLHEEYNKAQSTYGKNSQEAQIARTNWKAAIKSYNLFINNKN